MVKKSSELAEVPATSEEVRADPAPIGPRSGGSRPEVAEPDPLDSLTQMAELLSGPLRLRTALTRVLERLERDLAANRAAVMLLDAESAEIRIEASVGFDESALRARDRLGEGIAGRVISSGQCLSVAIKGRDPLLGTRASRKGTRPGPSVVCMPIALDRKPVGALAVELDLGRPADSLEVRRYLGLLAAMIAQALKLQRVADERHHEPLDGKHPHPRFGLQQRFHLNELVGTSESMQEVYEQVVQVAQTDTTVLIRGESGTGKELIARAIHSSSPRADRPFVKVSVAALPDTLIESELFGFEEGAFTGAHGRKRGRFELADGGTLFLDDICELSLSAQVKLLRVLQEREFERLGGTAPVHVDVRVIASTNRDLKTDMADGQFRDDLYHRLNVFPVLVPPLRDRMPDVMLLADFFLVRYARQHGKSVRRIAPPALDMLMSYHWPGNVRELENAVERAVLTCEGQIIHGHDLPPALQIAEASGSFARQSFSDTIEQYEKDLILDALERAHGNRAKAARLLGTTERIIGYRVGKYQIDVDRFRIHPSLDRPLAPTAAPPHKRPGRG